MNAELMADWIKALRSGEYKQGTEYLRRTVDGEDCFCATGVLCDVSWAGEWIEHDDGTYSYVAVDGEGEPIGMASKFSVPYEVGDLLSEGTFSAKYEGDLFEISRNSIDDDETLADITELTSSTYGDVSVEYLNDSGCSFEQIADLLESDIEIRSGYDL